MTPFEIEMRRIAYELMENHAPEFLAAIKRDMKTGRSLKQIENQLKQHDLQNKHITIQSAILAARHMQANPATFQE